MPRINNDANVEYTEKKVKGLLDRVTAKLSGSKSGVFTRLGARYKEIDDEVKRLTDERETLNEQVKGQISALFDAEDEVLTRVIESVSLVATLSKKTPATVKPVETFDTEGFINEIYESLPELKEQLDIIRAKYVTLSHVDVPEKDHRLTVKLNDSVNLNESDSRLGEYAELVKRMVSRNLKGYDQRIAAIKAQVG